MEGRAETRGSDMGAARVKGVREFRAGGGVKSEGKRLWRRCLVEGGESGVSVIGEREIVRPHCILGSPSS